PPRSTAPATAPTARPTGSRCSTAARRRLAWLWAVGANESRSSGLALGREHRATAVACPAMAGEQFLDFILVVVVDRQAVVVEQLLAWSDLAQRLDEHAVVVLVDVGLAVRVAGVVDPARRVAADVGIDHVPVVDVKEERVVRILGIVRMPLLGFL